MTARKAELVRWILGTPGPSGPWQDDTKPSDHSKPGAELVFRSEDVINAVFLGEEERIEAKRKSILLQGAVQILKADTQEIPAWGRGT